MECPGCGRGLGWNVEYDDDVIAQAVRWPVDPPGDLWCYRCAKRRADFAGTKIPTKRTLKNRLLRELGKQE